MRIFFIAVLLMLFGIVAIVIPYNLSTVSHRIEVTTQKNILQFVRVVMARSDSDAAIQKTLPKAYRLDCHATSSLAMTTRRQTAMYHAEQLQIESNPYKRIVSLAPSMSETIAKLGKPLLLVGITSHDNDGIFSHAKEIGSFAEPNFEAILALNPDLVLAVPHVMAKNTIDALIASGIEVFAHQPDSLDDIKYINSTVATKLNIKETGLLLNKDLDEAILRAKNMVSHLSIGDIKTALIAVSHTPFVVAGKNTFASEIIEALGFINMADDPKTSWPIWPLENILTNPPKILILADGNENELRYKNLFKSLGFDYKKTILLVPKKNLFTSPSPAVIEDIAYLIDLLQENLMDQTW